jgi:hypothetical protein
MNDGACWRSLTLALLVCGTVTGLSSRATAQTTQAPSPTITSSPALQALLAQARTANPTLPIRRTIVVTTDAAIIEYDRDPAQVGIPGSLVFVDLLAVGQPSPVRATGQTSATALVLGDIYGDGTLNVDVELTICVDMNDPSHELAEPYGNDWAGHGSCGVIRRGHYALRPSGWALSQTPLPTNPDHKIQIDGDAIPAFDTFSGAGDSQIVEAWDGHQFATDLKVFLPWYAHRLAESRAQAALVKAVADKSTVCPWKEMRTASGVYVYARVNGVTNAEAIQEADDVMHGYSMTPCARDPNHRSSQPWATERARLLKKTFPTLSRDRAVPAAAKP